MRRLRHLWPSLERSACLLEVTKQWQGWLREEYEPLRRFFVATDCIASSYPGSGEYQRFRVVADDPNDICGVDDDTGEEIELSRADIACYRFNVQAFTAEMATALGLAPQFTALADVFNTWKIGTLPIQLGARPVYFTLRSHPHDLSLAATTVASHAHQPYLLLQATGRWRNEQSDAVVQTTAGHTASAAEFLFLSDSGRLVAAPDALRSLAALMGFSPLDQPEGSIFKLEGEFRVVVFAGKRTHLKEAAGLWYLARLLASPNRDIPAAELEADRTGVDATVATGSTGEAIDGQARAEFKQRLEDLASEIDLATRNNDVGQLDRLQTERSQLIDTLKAATGLGGRTRTKTDADRARKAVSGAVARDMKRIRKHHPALARHLEGAVSQGLVFRYAPDREIDWVL